MLLKNIKGKLLAEFDQVRRGRNPKITKDIEAVVVLSGESQDPAFKTNWQDTEERLAEGIRIYKKIQALGGSAILVLNGTDPQNTFMQDASKKHGIVRFMIIKNPPYPIASTKTQIEGIKDLKFKKMAIVIHADYGPRTKRYMSKFLKDFDAELFLIGRDKMKQSEAQIEIKKILKYFPEEFSRL